MKRTASLKAAAIVALICTANPPHLCGELRQTQPDLKADTFAGFSVSVTLSDKARALLVDHKETIIVAAYFAGFPKPGTPRKFIAQGQVGLGQSKVEVAPGVVAKFGPTKLDHTGLSQIDNKGPQLLINVYSGRRSSKDNLLDCGIYEDALAPVEGTTIPIACKLIAE